MGGKYLAVVYGTECVGHSDVSLHLLPIAQDVTCGHYEALSLYARLQCFIEWASALLLVRMPVCRSVLCKVC